MPGPGSARRSRNAPAEIVGDLRRKGLGSPSANSPGRPAKGFEPDHRSEAGRRSRWQIRSPGRRAGSPDDRGRRAPAALDAELVGRRAERAAPRAPLDRGARESRHCSPPRARASPRSEGFISMMRGVPSRTSTLSSSMHTPLHASSATSRSAGAISAGGMATDSEKARSRRRWKPRRRQWANDATMRPRSTSRKRAQRRNRGSAP